MSLALLCAAGCGGGGGGGGSSPAPPVVTPSPSPSAAPALATVASVTLSIAQPYPAVGIAAHVPLTVTAKDTHGNVIAPPARYANPITLTNEVSSPHAALSTTVVQSAADVVTLDYDGGYFPMHGIHADWPGLAGTEPRIIVATGVANAEWNLGTGHNATSVTRGGDGAIWFADQSGAIGRVSAPGSAAFYAVGSGWQPMVVAAGTDRAIWFTATGAFNAVGPYQGVGRVALDGTMGPVWQTSSSYGRDVVVATDGNAYFNQLNHITRVTPSGTMSDVVITASYGTVHTDTLAAGPDGALYATGLGSLYRYDIASGTTTSTAFPAGALGPAQIDPQQMIATANGKLYYDDSGVAIYTQTIPTGTPALIGRGSATPGQGDALSPAQLVVANDGSLWFASWLPTLDGHPMFGHVVGGAAELLVGQNAVAHPNGNGQFVTPSSITLGSDGRLWYSRGDALGSFAP